jgi:hypothetical protein
VNKAEAPARRLLVAAVSIAARIVRSSAPPGPQSTSRGHAATWCCKRRLAALRAFRQVQGYAPMARTPIEDYGEVMTAAAAGKACRDAIASELRSMINGYWINSHRVFPFIRRRRHPPTNSQYAFKAAVPWHTTSVGSADARVGGITWREQLRQLDERGRMYATDRGGPY